MTNLSPDVRDSTLSALKLTCPSAEVLEPAQSRMDHPIDNPFADGDAEWSDEEELIPKTRRKTPYVPPHIKVTAARLSATETDESSSNEPSPNRLSVNGSPIPPPKSPSRPDIRAGSSQEDLVLRFYEVTRERDALRKQLQRKSMGPHGIPARASIVYKSEEKSLIEALQALRYEIRVWSEEYFSGPLSSRSKHPRVKSAGSLFGSLTDNYNAYLKHYTDRPLLIQAYIWSMLQRKIFSTLEKGCGYIWAGKLGDRKLRPLNDILRKGVANEEQAEEYHHWRALTVSLLVPQVDGRWRPVFDADPILRRISRFSSRLRRKLRPWASRSLRDGREQLHTIVSAAVDLDLRLKRQRADYRFVAFVDGRPNQFWGFPFVEDEMEDIDEDNGRRRKVELSLAPALERCGNANGHVFDQSFILVKADVSCKRLEKRRPMAKKRGGGNGIRRLWDNYN